MGLRDWISRLLHHRQLRFEALRSDDKAMQSLAGAEISEQTDEATEVAIQRDSLELGLAAGYTGRAIKEMEASLNRIELQMATKDWVMANFQSSFLMLENILKNMQNDVKNTEKRLENIENYLKSNEMHVISHISEEKTPIPHLTAKMRELLSIVEQAKEISYFDLSQRLGISISSLRGLLSIVVRRTGKVKRFERDNKGWVSYIQDMKDRQDIHDVQDEGKAQDAQTA